MDTSSKSIQKRDFISALAKGLDVLLVFSEENARLSMAELAQKLDISRASARRFLLTLEHLGYLCKEGQQFRLTSKVLNLGASYFSSMPLPAIAQPYLTNVTKLTEESCSLGVLDNDMLVFVARAQSRWIMNFALSVGTQLPAYCTAMGRVLLSNMSQEYQKHYLNSTDLKAYNEKSITNRNTLIGIFETVKRQGYAIVDQELELGLRSVAVPIVLRGKVVASISISSQINRATLKRIKDEFLPILRETAEAISKEADYKVG